MSVSLVLPGVAVVLVAVIAGRAQWSDAPAMAMRVLTVILALASATVLLVLVAMASGFVARSSIGLAVLERCPRLGLVHHRVGAVEGAIALGALAVIGIRIVRVLRRLRWAVDGTKGRHLLVLHTDEPIAYAAPGKPGCVVVSRGLLGVLSLEERRAMFAHERAHLSQHHHRYLLVGAIATAIAPVLSGAAEQLRLATERCADEAAVKVMGGDREAVAVSIGRAALATASFGGVVGAFGGGSIPLRVHALLDEPATSLVRRVVIVAVSVGLAVAIGSSVQVHHLYELAAHVCA